MVSSEQVVKPRSRLAVVKPEVLHLRECQLPELYYVYEFGQLKMGVGLIKWAWPKTIRARSARINATTPPL